MQEKCKPLDFHKANIFLAQTDENRDSFNIIKYVAFTPFIPWPQNPKFSS